MVRFRRRMTPAGLLTAAALVLSAIFGLDTTLTMAYQAFTFLLFLLILALGASLIRKPPEFAWDRRLPRFGTVGEPLPLGFVAENGKGSSAAGLSLFLDLAPAPVTGPDAWTGTAEPLERSGLRTLYRHWRRLQQPRTEMAVREYDLPSIPAGGRAELSLDLVPDRRGRLDFSGLAVARRDPVGLFRSIRRQPLAGSVMVLPRLYPVPPSDLAGNRRYQPGGVALAQSVGDAEEFVSLREYRPGDPLRKIHWKSWAKRGIPIVKEHQDEFFVRHGLVLDTFFQGGSPDLFEEAVSVAASLAASVLTQESLLDLLFIGPEAYCFTSGRGVAHVDRMLEILASVRICRDHPFSSLPPLVTRRAELLSACILVLLAWDEERMEFVKGLRSLGLPLTVMVLVEPDRPPLDPGPMADDPKNFRPLEVGRVAMGLRS